MAAFDWKLQIYEKKPNLPIYQIVDRSLATIFWVKKLSFSDF